MRTLVDRRLADELAESVRRSHADAIKELQAKAEPNVLRGVVVPNGGQVIQSHRLGRAPVMVIVSPVRGAVTAGVIGERRGTTVAGSPIDATQVICLTASGFGADVTVDVEVK